MAGLEAVLRISAVEGTAPVLAEIKKKIEGLEKTTSQMDKFVASVGRVTRATDPLAGRCSRRKRRWRVSAMRLALSSACSTGSLLRPNGRRRRSARSLAASRRRRAALRNRPRRCALPAPMAEAEGYAFVALRYVDVEGEVRLPTRGRARAHNPAIAQNARIPKSP